MEAKSKQPPTQKQTTENFIKDIRRKTRKLYFSEQKILIVMEALRGEESVVGYLPQARHRRIDVL
jgi:hypothetical protein